MSKISYHELTRDHLAYRMKWLNDPEVNNYLGLRVRLGTDKKFHEAWFDKYKNDETREIFMIESDGKIIGQIGLLDINLQDKNADLYILIGEKDHQGKGFGTEAVKFILSYGFDNLHMHKISLGVHSRNTIAVKLYKKFGFRQEGILKDNILYKDGYDDEIRMAKFNPKE